jgi:xylulokinase
MAKYYIGFDAGTQSVKVVIYNLDMECIAEAGYPTKIDYPQPSWVQMDINGYLEAVKLGMRDCVNIMKEKDADPKDIRSIFGDGIICGIVGIDEEGDAITPYINYMDTRTQEDVDAINAMGLDIWAKETGNAVANSMFPAMFARWFLKNDKDFQERGVKFIHNAPYVLMHLAGNKAADAAEDWGVISGWGLGYDIYKKMVTGTAPDFGHQSGLHAEDRQTLGHHRRPDKRYRRIYGCAGRYTDLRRRW